MLDSSKTLDDRQPPSDLDEFSGGVAARGSGDFESAVADDLLADEGAEVFEIPSRSVRCMTPSVPVQLLRPKTVGQGVAHREAGVGVVGKDWTALLEQVVDSILASGERACPYAYDQHRTSPRR